jgi:hypothetical protein
VSKKQYVIFHAQTISGREVYLAAAQNGPLVTVTNTVQSAMRFSTARNAYAWAARQRGLGHWRVGAR